MMVTKELIKSRNVPDIGYISIFSEDYINESNNLIQEKTKNIMFTKVQSPSQQEFKY